MQGATAVVVAAPAAVAALAQEWPITLAGIPIVFDNAGASYEELAAVTRRAFVPRVFAELERDGRLMDWLQTCPGLDTSRG